jgi:putative flippase GtrA
MSGLASQLGKFGVVGIVATLVHAATLTLAVEALAVGPMRANVAGFGVAVFVSFFGNFRWTFRPAAGAPAPALPLIPFGRFLLAAGSGFALNTAFVYVVTGVLGRPYFYALPFIVFVTPAFLFMVSKFWVFRS